MSQRYWKDFPKKLRIGFGQASPYIGILSILLSISLAVDNLKVTGGTPLPEKLFIIPSFLLLLVLIIVAMKAIPPYTNPAKLIDKKMKVNSLENLHPKLILKIGILGTSRVGKSTLLNNLREAAEESQVTQEVYCYITSISNKDKELHIALIDGSGSFFAHQFQVSTPADILIVLIDHNAETNEPVLDKSRLEEQSAFFKQIRAYFSFNEMRIKWTHILLNRRDIWEKMSKVDKDFLESFMLEEESEWKKSNLCNEVTHAKHTNKNPNDIYLLKNKIREWYLTNQ